MNTFGICDCPVWILKVLPKYLIGSVHGKHTGCEPQRTFIPKTNMISPSVTYLMNVHSAFNCKL